MINARGRRRLECAARAPAQWRTVYLMTAAALALSAGACERRGFFETSGFDPLTLLCGNGRVDLDYAEECDDAGTSAGDGCSATCVVEPGWACTGEPSVCAHTCGNGFLEAGEACDDGGLANGDGCTASCAVELGYACTGEPSVCAQTCGNAIIDPGEACDDNNLDPSDGCSGVCAVEPGWSCTGEPSACVRTCGNGTLDTGEACDDGDRDNSDGCNAGCVVEPGWSCYGAPSICTESCGNGAVDFGEQCDDGGLAPADGCSASCAVEVGWACAGEPSVCSRLCGNGRLDLGEECDDGGTAPDDGCSSRCSTEPGWSCPSGTSCVRACGNGALDAGEQCDDGGTAEGDGCSSNCTVEVGFDCDPPPCTPKCGDGRIAGWEECEDGNTATGDGCGDCLVEDGWSCDAGLPTACTSICGDGLVVGTEECDDNDTSPGDGCGATCRRETYFQCSGQPSTCGCSDYWHGAACDLCVVFVQAGATGTTGLTWATAFGSVQTAIDKAAAVIAGSGRACEVWVAEGTYNVYTSGPADTILLEPHVELYGGFAGTEAARADRNVATHATILDGSQSGVPANRVYHVVTGTSFAVLDGFTIRNGQATGTAEGDQSGGGMVARSVANATIANCTFASNSAATRGGGLYVVDGSEPAISGCTFSSNSATGGGGLAIDEFSTPTVSSCTFTGNSATNQGGGLFVTAWSDPTISTCTFDGNTSASLGGGFSAYHHCNAVVTDSTFRNNTAAFGGAVNNRNWGATTFERCLFASNRATTTTAGEGGGAVYDYNSDVTLTDCRFVGNTSAAYGGAIVNQIYSVLTLTGCTFANNTAAAYAGALYIYGSSPAAIDRCIFSYNAGTLGGALLAADVGTWTVSRSVFVANRATTNYGGAIFHSNCSPTIESSVFVSNAALNATNGYGGAIFSQTNTTATFRGVTFTRNTARTSGATIYNDANSDPTVTNVILYDDTNGGIVDGTNSSSTVTYSDYQGGHAGTGNINIAPGFVGQVATGQWEAVGYSSTDLRTTLTDNDAAWAPGALVGTFAQVRTANNWRFYVIANTATTITVDGDLTTLAASGDGFAIFDYRLASTSPCMDAGNGAVGPTTDLNGRARVDGPVANTGTSPFPDLGAYEYIP